MHLEGEDDAFLVNREGVIQSASRFSGAVLSKSFVKASMLPTRYSPADLKIIEEKGVTVGYVPVRNSPWTLVIVTKHDTRDKIMELLRKDYSLVYLTLLLIIIGLIANYLIAQKIASRLEASDREKQAALQQTEHASKLASIGRLAAGVAHEINNPLAIINEKAGLMKDIMNIVPEFNYKDKFAAQINSIQQSVERCRTITHRLLGFARQMDVSLEVLDLNLLLKDVIGFLEREMMYRNIQLDLLLDDNIPAIESDRGQLQQVFLNIINNALDAVNDGGNINVKTYPKDEETVSVSIKDNGHGIPADKLKHVFEPFFSTKERGKGTGLGLSITYGIVKKLGGSIDVQSTVNEGTTFVVDLPKRFFVPTEGGE
jgi:two-component system NtrC family sensor kinase